MSEEDPFGTIAAAPPALEGSQAETIAHEYYGIDVTSRALVSERDQNFLLTGADGSRSILKIANIAEPRDVTLFQVEALLHIEKHGSPDLGVPRIHRTINGDSSIDIGTEQGTHICRLVSFLPGSLMEDRDADAVVARSLGEILAKLDMALQDFTHSGEQQALLWDMKQAPALRRLLQYVDDEEVRVLLAATLDEFDGATAPRFASLPWQVIHNDANPANVLLTDDGEVAGLIDFGDMLRSPRIIELGVAASYLRVDSGNPLALFVELVAGYHAVAPLGRDEVSVLHSLIKTRLASTLLILAWRRHLRGPDDEYLVAANESEASALPFLRRLTEIPAENAAAIYSQVCASVAVSNRTT